LKAVIPAAGLGTRFLPASKVQPKEMLPVVDKPVIQYVLEEAVASGIYDVLIITGRGKRAIEDHFDKAFELEYILRQNGKTDILDDLDNIRDKVDIHYLRQREAKGLGHAILCGKKHVGDEPFAVMLGDTINISKTPVTKQLMDVHEEQGNSVIAVEHLPQYKIPFQGIIAGEEVSPRLWKINNMVEKPKVEDAPSNIGITGTYLLTPEIFNCLERTPPGYGGEIQLTDAMKMLLEKETILGFQFEGTRFDIGNKFDWFKAQFSLTLQHEEFGEDMRKFTHQLLDDLSR